MNTEFSKETKVKSSLGLVITLMAGYSMVYMDKNMVSTAIMPIAEQFKLDTSQTGLIMSLFFLGYSLMQIPGGWLADKIGAKKVLLISLGIMSTFSFIFGSVSSLMLFIGIRFFDGIGHAGYPPSCSKCVADNFPQEKRTFVQSAILSTSGIGGVLAFTLGAGLINQNWRYGYVVLGSLFLIAFFLVLFFIPNTVISKKGENAKAKQEGIKFSQIITNRNVIILFLAMMLLNFELYGNVSWLPTYLRGKFDWSIGQVSMLLAFNAVVQTLTSFFIGSLLSKLFLGKEKKVLIGAGVLCTGLIFGFIKSENVVLSIILLLLVTVVSISAFTTIFTWPHKLFDRSMIGSSIGIINTGGTLGGFFSPMILGYLVKAAGGNFDLAFSFMAAATLLCGFSVLLIKKEN